MNGEVIEIESYEGGKWVTRRYPLGVLVSLIEQGLQQLPVDVASGLVQRAMAALAARAHPQPEQFQEDRLRVLVD